MKKVPIRVKRLPNSAGIDLPRYATELSAGTDLLAAIENAVILPPGERVAVPTGIAIELPKGYEAQIRPRSGLAIKYGVTCLNSPGTIDPDYRGELFIILINHGKEKFKIERGMRIAQLVLSTYNTVSWLISESLDQTKRGEGGLGSTGK